MHYYTHSSVTAEIVHVESNKMLFMIKAI